MKQQKTFTICVDELISNRLKDSYKTTEFTFTIYQVDDERSSFGASVTPHRPLVIMKHHSHHPEIFPVDRDNQLIVFPEDQYPIEDQTAMQVHAKAWLVLLIWEMLFKRSKDTFKKSISLLQHKGKAGDENWFLHAAEVAEMELKDEKGITFRPKSLEKTS